MFSGRGASSKPFYHVAPKKKISGETKSSHKNGFGSFFTAPRPGVVSRVISGTGLLVAGADAVVFFDFAKYR